MEQPTSHNNSVNTLCEMGGRSFSFFPASESSTFMTRQRLSSTRILSHFVVLSALTAACIFSFSCHFWTEREQCEYRGDCDPELASLALFACVSTNCNDQGYLSRTGQTSQQCLNTQAVMCAVGANEYSYDKEKSTKFGSGGVCVFNC